MIVIPVGLAGAANDPQATASASVKKQVKKLKRQVNQLRQQVEDVSKQAGPQGPQGPQGPPGPATGPAGGDLTGTFPNPLIGPAAVGSAEIADNAVASAKIDANAVGPEELAFNSVGSDELQTRSVGADDVKRVTAAVGSGVTVNAGTPANAQVTCPSGEMVIGAGYAWLQDEANSIIASAPSETNPNGSWIVRGMVDAGSNTLFAWANCLAS